jgi:hypothetical protein
MKKFILLVLAVGSALSVSAQRLALKNNLIYDAALTPNLSLEIGLAPKSTLDIGGNYNPFTFKNNKKLKHWLVQPEMRFWSCERFNGFFWGIHALGGEFNVGGVKLPFNIFPQVKDHRYEGYYYGAGASIGNQWILGPRWNLEASIGVGYIRYHYDRYECARCGAWLNKNDRNYFGVTKATLSLVYLLR